MFVTKSWIEVVIALAAILGWVGCKPAVIDDGRKPTATEHEHHEGDGHDHEGHDHDGKGHTEGAHAKVEHSEEGPHHGQLIELGQEEYHAELAIDDAAKTVTIYLFDASVKTSVSVSDPDITLNLVVNGAPQQFKVAASPQPGDSTGQSSRFSTNDEKVLEALEAPKTIVQFNLTIAGKTYAGKIEHLEHHHHGEHEPK